MHIGFGNYDYDTGIWTPTSSDVYAFDAEIYDVENMYSLFLQGVASIVPGFEPTDICETIEEFDEDTQNAQPTQPDAMPPIGNTAVSFVLNGKRFERVLGFYGDWFNDSAIDWVNEILEQEGFDGRLHIFFDGMQGLYLFYGDAEYGEKLRRIIPEPYS
ncbi:MAG: hypothetical protein ACOYI8_10705 [Christensenellales bacterium]